MITPRITCCKECVDIVPLIAEIDCRLSKLSNSAYNNIVYALNNSMNQTEALSLLFYKRILQYKIVNPKYAGAYSVEMIASKIKKYTVGCEPNCNCEEMMKSLGTTTSTTSTSTSTSTTTSTTTTAPVTTTTTTTAVPCDSWFYNVTVFTCGCVQQSNQTHSNGAQLNIGSFYYSASLGKKVLVNGIDFPCDDEGVGTFINPASEGLTCAAIVCPSTTTTTTTT